MGGKIPDDGQRNCPKHVAFYSKNKFEKLVNLVGFIIRTALEYICRYGQKLTMTPDMGGLDSLGKRKKVRKERAIGHII